MSNHNLLRSRFELLISGAVHEARNAGDVEHAGLAGTIREILVERVLQPALPPDVRFGTGKLLDRAGNLSRQIDIVLYSPHVLPPGLFDNRIGLFPVESCLYAVEVKSKLTAVNLSDAIENARSARALEHVNTFHYSGTKSEKTGTPAPINVLFAFDSDLEGHMKTELDRYLELDHAESPAITVLCVVGKGYWAVTSKGWRYYKPSEQFGEVLSFLAGVSNTIPKLLSAKGRPQFGSYLIDENTGVLVKPAS